MNFPFVIWSGTEPLKGKGRFRLVHRGPARDGRPDDVPFGLEQKTGASYMKTFNWEAPTLGTPHAIHALSHTLGQVLTVDPKKLTLDHPLYCELNLAVCEGREPKGCDCAAPADPETCQ